MQCYLLNGQLDKAKAFLANEVAERKHAEAYDVAQKIVKLGFADLEKEAFQQFHNSTKLVLTKASGSTRFLSSEE